MTSTGIELGRMILTVNGNEWNHYVYKAMQPAFPYIRPANPADRANIRRGCQASAGWKVCDISVYVQDLTYRKVVPCTDCLVGLSFIELVLWKINTGYSMSRFVMVHKFIAMSVGHLPAKGEKLFSCRNEMTSDSATKASAALSAGKFLGVVIFTFHPINVQMLD